MRLLANENFPLEAVVSLRNAGHDVWWVRTQAPGISDAEVLERVRQERRVLLTFDKDFGELAFHSQLPLTTGIILFRVKSPSSTHLAKMVVSVLNSRDDWVGNFAVIESFRMRFRPLPSPQAEGS